MMSGADSPAASSGEQGTWAVYRQDDNGNRYVV